MHWKTGGLSSVHIPVCLASLMVLSCVKYSTPSRTMNRVGFRATSGLTGVAGLCRYSSQVKETKGLEKLE